MDFGVNGKVALVCASTSGLGLATAIALAAEGARVVVNGRSQDQTERVAAEIPGAIAVGIDLTAPDGARDLFSEVENRLGSPDILVLNGPGPAPGSATDVDSSGIDQAAAVLIRPQVTLIRQALPEMRTRGWGRILSISSTSITSPIANLALSNLGRSALAGYLKMLATEIAGDGITVNSLLPGRIATPRAREVDEANAQRSGRPIEDVAAQSVATIPVGRYGTPEEFGAAAAFLCSAHASYLTGVALRCDGGATPVL